MSAEQIGFTGVAESGSSFVRRRPSPSPAPRVQVAPVITHVGGTAVDPVLIAAPLDGTSALDSGLLRFAARLTTPSDAQPIAGATILFTISSAARTSVKCAAVTDSDGVARAESTLPTGLFDRGMVEFRVGFSGAPPQYWPVSVAGTIV